MLQPDRFSRLPRPFPPMGRPGFLPALPVAGDGSSPAVAGPAAALVRRPSGSWLGPAAGPWLEALLAPLPWREAATPWAARLAALLESPALRADLREGPRSPGALAPVLSAREPGSAGQMPLPQLAADSCGVHVALEAIVADPGQDWRALGEDLLAGEPVRVGAGTLPALDAESVQRILEDARTPDETRQLALAAGLCAYGAAAEGARYRYGEAPPFSGADGAPHDGLGDRGRTAVADLGFTRHVTAWELGWLWVAEGALAFLAGRAPDQDRARAAYLAAKAEAARPMPVTLALVGPAGAPHVYRVLGGGAAGLWLADPNGAAETPPFRLDAAALGARIWHGEAGEDTATATAGPVARPASRRRRVR